MRQKKTFCLVCGKKNKGAALPVSAVPPRAAPAERQASKLSG